MWRRSGGKRVLDMMKIQSISILNFQRIIRKVRWRTFLIHVSLSEI